MVSRREREWTASRRAQALAHLDAARHYLDTCMIEEFARELVIQGLDVVTPRRRARLVLAALDELNDDESR